MDDQNFSKEVAKPEAVKIEVAKVRKAHYPITPLILNRWSPRAMNGEPLSDEELFPLLEAAHWAPSSYNNQPWRFLYAKRETPEWSLFFDPLIDFNKLWVKNAAVLIAAVSRNHFLHNEKPCRTHSFDTGCAWGYLALEGSRRGLVVHGMEGFDWDLLAKNLKLDAKGSGRYSVEAMIAVGKPGTIQTLPKEIQEKEVISTRRAFSEIAYPGALRE